MSSNDKTSDLLVATTRATKADEATQSAPAKKTVSKKAVSKKTVAKKSVAKKAPVKKSVTSASKGKAGVAKKEEEQSVSFGRRVWPD